jgi:uncharacterized protein
MPNHLLGAISPYLLQHVHHPVDWRPWGEEALERARTEDKPIFLSIGYAACHWCHVMAHESFEDPRTAAFLNEHFVCIKVDREERPDLDALYMSAVIALTGRGGWPMSVFLTPDQRPFFAGTYYPPDRRHGLPAFMDVLVSLSDAWRKRRGDVLRSGEKIAVHLSEGNGGEDAGGPLDRPALAAAARALAGSSDRTHGGWGESPKFPQPMAIEFLLRRHTAGDEGTLSVAERALRAMARGGFYDVVGGGFARYSTDRFWRVPHFEKMLYDNAQLARAYLHAWQVTGVPEFRTIAEDTLDFAAREMLSAEGGFYSSLDADSAGEEGRYYVWTLNEIRAALGGGAPFFEAAYGLTAEGPGDGKIVLQRAASDEELARRFGLSSEQAVARLVVSHGRLRTVRNTRIRPGTDDKILTAWNGLMLASFAEAARVFDDPRYLEIAVRNADFLLTAMRPGGSLRRAWRAGRAGREVFLEDYAALILGLLELYQSDFDNRWFKAAVLLTEEMVSRFADPSGGFFDTPDGAEKLLIRSKELQDNATPSGNALAADALFRMALFTGKTEWQKRAESALDLVSGPAGRFPIAFGRWLSAADFAAGEVRQIAIIGDPADPDTKALLREIRRAYHPDLIAAAAPAPPPEGAPPFLAGRPALDGRPTAYVCVGFICRAPVTCAEDLGPLLS